MNALVTTTMPLTYADIERLGANIAKSGLFGIRTPEQAVVLMMIAQAEGRHPALAARDYDIIGGRPAKKAEAMLRDFLEGGGKVEWHALTDDKAEATFSHPAGGKARITWDMARANKAGLGGKENYKKFPRQMLRNRVVSEGVRTIYPSATSGLYEPGEVADFSGPTIEHEPSTAAVDQSSNQQTPKSETQSQRDAINAEVKLEDEPQPKRMTWGQLLRSYEMVVHDATSADEIRSMLRSPQMAETKAHIGKAKSEHQQKFEEIMIMADARLQELTQPADDDEAPEINGTEKVMAG